ncbi:MAG: M48 family metallopeptidase [Alphaproteobacteria bacterium]|nr:M48 family metallopeptidase [Alphaproteobacteria bacterium]
MKKTILIGTPPIAVQLQRSSRARKYALKVSNSDGQVRLVVPAHGAERAAVTFAQKHEVWLRAALARLPKILVPEFGGVLMFEGRELALRTGAGRSVRLLEDALEVPGRPDQLAARLRGFLKVAARERLVDASHRHAEHLGQKVNRVTLRDTRSRWGSCSEAGNLMFSWRLVMAPKPVLDYVAAHEVAHLVEMNHSKAFWGLVAGLMPEFEHHRAWLKQNGALLHRVVF